MKLLSIFRPAVAVLACCVLASCAHNPMEPATSLVSADQTVALPQMRHVLIYADFGDRAQPFEQAFVAKAREDTASCGVALDFELVAHATTLTLDPPRRLTIPELSTRMAAVGADGLVRVSVTSWNSQGGLMPARLDQPLTRGRYTLSVTLARQAAGKVAWSGTYQQRIEGTTGGDQLADHMMRQFAGQGAFPKCSFMPPA